MKPLPQFPLLKGLQAANSILAQPKGSVARISNLCYKKRGAASTIDGTEIINWYDGALQNNRGMFEAISLFQPLNVARYFLTLLEDPDMHLIGPSGVTATPSAGGSLVSGTTYYYKVTALDGTGGETTASAEGSATPSGGNLSVTLNWGTTVGAVAYNVYRGVSPGGEILLSGAGLPATSPTFIDDGTAVPAGSATYPLLAAPSGAVRTQTGFVSNYAFTSSVTLPNLTGVTSFNISGVGPSFDGTGYPLYGQSSNTLFSNVLGTRAPATGGGGIITVAGSAPPLVNTTSAMALVKMPNFGTYPITYTTLNYVTLFPPAPVVVAGGDPAGTGGGGGFGGGGIVGGTSPTPLGGVPGGTSTVPLMVQFNNQEILALGNGYPPQIFSDPNTVAAITNNFIPAYPSWTATSQFALNSIVQPSTPNGNYFIAVQSGESGGTEPAWASIPDQGQQIADGTMIWQNAGPVQNSAPAPPGAAHAIVYSGSLWVANTWPNDNTNGIDGPCSLRMSDTNAPNSWNPINQAFLDKDDGTEIQGMATFTISAQGIPPEGSLVVFKDFSTYQIQGVFGASNFAIQRVVTDMGCVAPRSIQFVPGFGIVRLTHLGFAKFDGVRDEIISEEIRPYLYPSNDISTADITVMDQNYSYGSYGFQTANPPMYCCLIPIGNSGGQLTRIVIYDLVTKEWGIGDLPFSLGCAAQVRAEGTIPIAMFGGFLDGALQRWQAGDVQWYTGAGAPKQADVAWSLRTQEVASQVADQRLYCRRLAIRGQNTNSTGKITVIPSVNGVPGNTYVSATLPIGDFEIFAPIARTGVRFHADISGTADVEIQGISFHTEPRPAGVPVVIS